MSVSERHCCPVSYAMCIQSDAVRFVDLKDGYRFGFNGMEKDNEVAEEGNSYTAEYWQYDSRLRRRWNVDPKSNPSISSYSVLGNNPIFYKDLLGDTITATQEGAEVYIRAFNNTLGELNPFSYNNKSKEIIYDKQKLEVARNLATCDQLDLINTVVFLIDNGQSTVNLIGWDQQLPHRMPGVTLKSQRRGGETATYIDDGKFLGADIYIATDVKIETGQVDYEGAQYDRFGMMTSYTNVVNVLRDRTSDEVSLCGLHELRHPFLRVTQPELSNLDHDNQVENFENRMRVTYQTGTQKTKVRFKGFGIIRYSIPKYIGGKAEKH